MGTKAVIDKLACKWDKAAHFYNAANAVKEKTFANSTNQFGVAWADARQCIPLNRILEHAIANSSKLQVINERPTHKVATSASAWLRQLQPQRLGERSPCIRCLWMQRTRCSPIWCTVDNVDGITWLPTAVMDRMVLDHLTITSYVIQ